MGPGLGRALAAIDGVNELARPDRSTVERGFTCISCATHFLNLTRLDLTIDQRRPA